MRTFALNGAVALALTLATPAHAQATFPQTQSEYYRAGQQFASCSAYFRYGASLARANSLEDTAVAIEGMERGWKVAGLFLLVEGLDASRQTQVEAIFDNFQAMQMDQIRGRREMAETLGQTYDPAEEFQAECGEWSDMQKAIIQAWRSGG